MIFYKTSLILAIKCCDQSCKASLGPSNNGNFPNVHDKNVTAMSLV